LLNKAPIGVSASTPPEIN